MKKVKQKLRFVGNIFWLVITAPDCVKKMKYESPSSTMTLVSMYVFFSLFAFLFGITFKKIGVVEYNGWFSFLIENPYVVFNKFFAYCVIALDLFYMYITAKNLWDKEEIKKVLNGYE